ncbi:MAG: DUF4381 domain-containing protein [Pseudolabrys sp.]
MAETAPILPPDPVAGLIDIPLPPEVGLWPQTWESRTVAVLLLASLAAGAWRLVHRRHANRYRRAALAELDRMEHDTPDRFALASLVRRTALAEFPREQVASLAGTAWLSFLDRTGGGQDFSAGPGRNLEISAYEPDPVDLHALSGAVRRWIKAHHA